MAKKPPAAAGETTTAAPAAPTALRYIGPPAAESDRYGVLVPGRVYQEADPALATYLVETHPDHWARA
jgi:hypothetical protein